MKVLHGPVNIGNQPWTLSRNERLLGARSDLVVNYSTWFGYPADRCLGEYGNRSLRHLSRRLAFGLSAPFRYDVLHFYFGRSMLVWDDLGDMNRWPFLDLRLARRMGRKVFMTLQGCDARLARRSNERNSTTACAKDRCTAFDACVKFYDADRERLLREVLPLCNRVLYLNPELGHYVEGGSFMPYANVDVERMEPVYVDRRRRAPKIVHAPSDESTKGTADILAALETLRGTYDFELILVKGKTHAEAMAIYADADIAIDQVLCGWYGGFAVELMAMGKPVICYLREEDFEHVPPAMVRELPIRGVRPDRLAEDIAAVLDARSEWPEWGRASRRFVTRWHDPARIARALLQAYADPACELDLASAMPAPLT